MIRQGCKENWHWLFSYKMLQHMKYSINFADERRVGVFYMIKSYVGSPAKPGGMGMMRGITQFWRDKQKDRKNYLAFSVSWTFLTIITTDCGGQSLCESTCLQKQSKNSTKHQWLGANISLKNDKNGPSCVLPSSFFHGIDKYLRLNATSVTIGSLVAGICFPTAFWERKIEWFLICK